MAVSPDEVRYGTGAELAFASTGGTRTVSADLQLGSSFPSRHLGAGTYNVDITQSVTGIPAVGAQWGLAVVADDGDVGGDYTVTGDVVDYVALGSQSAFPTTVQVTTPTSGVWRLVLTYGQNATMAQDGTSVDTSGTSDEYHWDSDGNTFIGGAHVVSSPTGTRAVSVIGALATVESITAPDNQKYGDAPTITLNLNPVGSATFRETFDVRVGVRELSTDGTLLDAFDATPDTSGALTTGSYNLDSAYWADPTDYYLHVGVNDTLGNFFTPSGQRPGIYSAGTVVGVTTDERSWVVFDTSGHGTGITRPSVSRAHDDGTTTIASGLYFTSVSTYAEAGRTNASAGFTRTDGTSAPNDDVFLRADLEDGYGDPLASTAVVLEVLDSDGTSEDSQSLTTDGSGRIDWSYTIATTDKAFNRFKRTSPDDPDSLGVHDGTFTAYKPSGKTGDYPDPVDGSVIRSFDGAQPARAKDVQVTGDEYPSGNRSAQTYDVFGVSSEIIFAGMWSGNTDERTTDANGAPTGVVSRSKVTAAGSFAFKTCGVIDETAFGIEDAADENPTDVWGRAFDNHAWTGRRAVYDRTLGAVDDAGTALPSQEQLDDPLGYSVHGTALQTFDTLAAPSDATVYAYYQGFARTTAQRATFGAAASEVVGFTGDTGMYGYKCQIVAYSIVRDDLAIVVSGQSGQLAVGSTETFTATAVQVLPDNRTLAKTFDGAPRIVLYQVQGSGQPLLKVTANAMTAVPSSDDYEFDFVPSSAGSYTAVVFGTVAGSRPAPGRTTLIAGFDTDVKMLVTTEAIQSDSGLVRRFVVKCVRESGGSLADVDLDAAPSFYVVAAPETGAMTVIASGTATAIGTPPTGDYEFDVTIPSSQKAIKVYVTGTVDGAPVIGGDVQSVQVGFALDAVGTLVGIHFK